MIEDLQKYINDAKKQIVNAKNSILTRKYNNNNDDVILFRTIEDQLLGISKKKEFISIAEDILKIHNEAIAKDAEDKRLSDIEHNYIEISPENLFRGISNETLLFRNELDKDTVEKSVENIDGNLYIPNDVYKKLFGDN